MVGQEGEWSPNMLSRLVGCLGFMAYQSIFIQIVLFQAIQFSQTVLIQSILFSTSIVLIYTQLNVKTVLFQPIQFSINTQFNCQEHFYFKLFSLQFVQFCVHNPCGLFHFLNIFYILVNFSVVPKSLVVVTSKWFWDLCFDFHYSIS